MSSSGGTTGSAITGGIATGLSIAEPLPVTWLSLSRYAQIMGIPRPHFFGSQASQAFPITGGCEMAWTRHSWQNLGRTSREEIAFLIEQVEDELSEFMGFNLAPTFVTNEMHQYPQHYGVDGLSLSGGLNSRGLYKNLLLKRGSRFISAGQRNTASVGTATTVGGSLMYTDEDGDGFAETATIRLSTTLTNACEIKAFHYGTNGQAAWEIKPARSKTITGGEIIMVFDSWLFIDPDLDAAYPDSDSYRALDITTTSNYVDSVDVYRVYVDNTLVSARFFWERDGSCAVCGGTGCDACSLTYQDGCAFVHDVNLGAVVPVPGTYDATNAIWTPGTFTVPRDPDQVRLAYYAGDISQNYFNGTTCDPLKSMYAKAIAWMATARLSKPVCSCPNLADNFEAMREDMTLIGEGSSHFLSNRDLDNPFGTRRGEVMAWNLLGKISREQMVEVAII